MRSIIATTIVLIGVSATVSHAQPDSTTTLPPAPEGFAWQVLPEVKGACLLPAGWHFRSEVKNGTHAYFLSVENIAEVGSFQTGMTINVVANVDKRTGKTAHQYALDFIQVRKEMGKETIVFSNEVRRGIFAGGLFRSSAPRPEGGNTIIHNIVLANTSTQTLYMIIFESPESSWDKAWKLGETMLQTYVFNEEY